MDVRIGVTSFHASRSLRSRSRSRVSLIPWKSIAWIAKQIPGAQLEIFEENEGGSHFMFVENPTKFNQIVSKFVA